MSSCRPTFHELICKLINENVKDCFKKSVHLQFLLTSFVTDFNKYSDANLEAHRTGSFEEQISRPTTNIRRYC